MSQFVTGSSNLYVTNDEARITMPAEYASYIITADGRRISLRPELVAEVRKAANGQMYYQSVMAEAADAFQALLDAFHVF